MALKPVIMKFRIGNSRKGKTLSFQGLLPELLDQLNIRESYLLEEIRSSWPEMTSNIMATHSIPDRIMEKVLVVSVDHQAYASELVLMKDHIIRKIGDRFGSGMVSSIRIETRKLKWVN